MPKFLSNSRARAGLIGLSLALLTTGCVTVGPSFHSPAPPSGRDYAMAGDAPADPNAPSVVIGGKVVADWWTLFQSPALDAIMRQAIAGSPTLEQARARLSQARHDAASEGGLLMADGTAGFKRERANLNAFSGGAFSDLPAGLGSFPTNPEYNLYSIGAAVSYNLDLFGGERRRRESLKATAEAQARALDAAYLTLTGQVVEQVLIIADANIQIRTLTDIVEHDQTSVAMIRQAHAAGGASKVDVATAEGQLAEDEAAIPAQRQRQAAARHQLAVLVGKAPSEWSPPNFDVGSGALPRALPLAIPSELVRSRPDIQEAEAQLHAATADIGVAEAARYPNITLNGGYNLDALSAQTLFSPIASSYALGPSLSLPIFHSGELKARQRAAQDKARAALAAYKQTVLEAFAQVADILQASAHDEQAYAAQTRAFNIADIRLKALRDSYRAGGISALQVVDAERSWSQARRAVAQLGSSRYADAAMLLLATATVPPGAAAGDQHAGQ